MSRCALIAIGLLSIGCGSSLRRFPLQEPLWVDPDRTPFEGKPEEYWSPLAWDGIDKTIFRPISKGLAVSTSGESVNVNALDEVPDSSWFENRLGKQPLGRADFFDGPCKGKKPLAADEPWTVVNAKPDGANPGFMIKAADGRKYLVKFETNQLERASSGDVVGTRLYWAAGFHTPCNQIVYMKPSILKIDPKAKVSEEDGSKVPLAQRHIDKIFRVAAKLDDGTYRANASLLFDGEPLGPFRYHDTRDDDPNDVVAHEDRRELRGSRVLAAWMNHHDAREQNSLDLWIETGKGRGYVQHALLDWGDTFGGLWDWDALSRRIGFAYYLDFEDVALDFLSLGIPRRAWDKVHFGAAGEVLGYFESELFDPEDWHVGYPNPAFSRMTERDAAWMTRIVARFDDEAVDAMIDAAQIKNPVTDRELRRIFKARRDKILRRWLGRLSPLTRPWLEPSDPPRLCLEDLIATAHLAATAARRYEARAFVGDDLAPTSLGATTSGGPSTTCVALPKIAGATKATPKYLVVDLIATGGGFDRRAPARVHLYALGSELRVVGLERPSDDEPPKP
jgi:hypothetical protein